MLSADPTSMRKTIVPLLVSPDIELISSAMFNRRGDAIEPSFGHDKQRAHSYVCGSIATTS